MSHVIRSSLVASLIGLGAAVSGTPVSAQGPVVRAVLFFSPTCPHCHKVINEDLPVIFDRFGGPPHLYFDTTVARTQVAFYEVTNGQVEVLLVDVSKRAGSIAFIDATERFAIESNGVPRLIVGDSVLIGSRDIPQELPHLIEQGLAGSGIDWPDISNLQTALAAIPGRAPVTVEAESAGAGETTTKAAPATVTEPDHRPEEPAPVVDENPARADTDSALAAIPAYEPTMIELYRQDPVGNSVSVLVLIGMVLSLALVGLLMRGPTPEARLTGAVPLIAAIGIGVAAYLTYIESSGAAAVCGPVGDCNTVNQSEYAMLFGSIPVAALGLAGYVAIILAWSLTRFGSGPPTDWVKLALLALCVAGTLFSVYLTFLEPFVIGATCAWCLTSAVAITVLMLLAARPGLAAWTRIRTR